MMMFNDLINDVIKFFDETVGCFDFNVSEKTIQLAINALFLYLI